ncbi:MAG: D-alanyl-D-alanine carboxypeptidase [Rhodospirillaceae bacterium]|nr:D-alanyl-D-alanine carboxypeptidase [Rhodospirillaceae bacterium]
MRPRLWTAVLAMALLAAAALAATPAPAMETAARHAIIVDFDTGAVLLQKDADVPTEPASMSKLMTVYVVFQELRAGRLHMDDMLPVSEKAWRTGGSKTFVEVGKKVSVSDLLHGVIVQSGNDACIVLAEAIAGSEEAFADLMNRRAQELGLTHSHFTNATGLPDPNHLMSVRDLAVLARHIITDFPEDYPLFAQTEFTFNGIRQENRNPLLADGADGLKTGHTEAAGYSLTASAARDGRRVIMVLQGLDSVQQRAEEGRRLLDWAFRAFENVTLAKAGQAVEEAPVWLGQRDTVPMVLGRDLVVTVPRGATANGMHAVATFQGPVPAPVRAGQALGRLTISFDDGTSVEAPLYAGADVGEVGFAGRMLKAFRYLVLAGS